MQLGAYTTWEQHPGVRVCQSGLCMHMHVAQFAIIPAECLLSSSHSLSRSYSLTVSGVLLQIPRDLPVCCQKYQEK